MCTTARRVGSSRRSSATTSRAVVLLAAVAVAVDGEQDDRLDLLEAVEDAAGAEVGGAGGPDGADGRRGEQRGDGLRDVGQIAADPVAGAYAEGAQLGGERADLAAEFGPADLRRVRASRRRAAGPGRRPARGPRRCAARVPRSSGWRPGTTGRRASFDQQGQLRTGRRSGCRTTRRRLARRCRVRRPTSGGEPGIRPRPVRRSARRPRPGSG